MKMILVNVTIPLNYEKKNCGIAYNDNGVGINEVEQRVIYYIGQNVGIAIKKLVDKSEYSEVFKKKLASLKAKNSIKRHGKKTGKGVIINR